MDAAAEVGRNPVNKHKIQPEYGDEQADAGRDSRTRLARPNSQARTGTQGSIHFTCSADHVQDWQLYPIDAYSSCYIFDHAYIQNVVFKAANNSRINESIFELTILTLQQKYMIRFVS